MVVGLMSLVMCSPLDGGLFVEHLRLGNQLTYKNICCLVIWW